MVWHRNRLIAFEFAFELKFEYVDDAPHVD
jgi:hypothetical protein